MAFALLVAISGPKTSQFSSIYIWIYSTQQPDQKRTGSAHKSDLCNLILLRNIYNFFKIIFIPNRPQVLFRYTQQQVKPGLVRLPL